MIPAHLLTEYALTHTSDAPQGASRIRGTGGAGLFGGMARTVSRYLDRRATRRFLRTGWVAARREHTTPITRT